MPLKDMATSTATFGFIRYVDFACGRRRAPPLLSVVLSVADFICLDRTLGGTMGISIGQAIFSSVSTNSGCQYPELWVSWWAY